MKQVSLFDSFLKKRKEKDEEEERTPQKVTQSKTSEKIVPSDWIENE